MLEKWRNHNRLQNLIFPENPQAVDKVALRLWEEELFFGKVRASPDLWWERVKNTERKQECYQRAKEKNTHTRVTLKDYSYELPDDIADEVAVKNKKRKSHTVEDLCESCGNYKFNKVCALRMCRKCCIKSPFPCTVPDHRCKETFST